MHAGQGVAIVLHNNQWYYVTVLFITSFWVHAQGIEPNAMSYNALLRHCARHNAAHDAVAIMKEMNDKGIHPNATSYTNAITAMIAGGLGRQALDQLELMRKVLWQYSAALFIFQNVLLSDEEVLRSKPISKFEKAHSCGESPNMICCMNAMLYSILG